MQKIKNKDAGGKKVTEQRRVSIDAGSNFSRVESRFGNGIGYGALGALDHIGEDGGADGFLFWSPGSSYRVVQASMAGGARGLLPFRYEVRGERKQMNYWQPPAEAMDDREMLCEWAQRGVEAADRAAAGKRRR